MFVCLLRTMSEEQHIPGAFRLQALWLNGMHCRPLDRRLALFRTKLDKGALIVCLNGLQGAKDSIYVAT